MYRINQFKPTLFLLIMCVFICHSLRILDIKRLMFDKAYIAGPATIGSNIACRFNTRYCMHARVDRTSSNRLGRGDTLRSVLYHNFIALSPTYY